MALRTSVIAVDVSVEARVGIVSCHVDENAYVLGFNLVAVCEVWVRGWCGDVAVQV